MIKERSDSYYTTPSSANAEFSFFFFPKTRKFRFCGKTGQVLKKNRYGN
ncbi:hypothetical protein SAMN05443094_10370 [Domibacillus enclensis]|uniref:Uncharacterized protein n=1 Tax=Domibacillus enclensis TaxID=1017273 RepID=A0A1N6TT26_9BACI|nr:hypothetical protein SAMN05443094_10370 [Domibacillus enclensis]